MATTVSDKDQDRDVLHEAIGRALAAGCQFELQLTAVPGPYLEPTDEPVDRYRPGRRMGVEHRLTLSWFDTP